MGDRYANLADRELAATLVREDADEQLGRLEADDRTTCYRCRAWAAPGHMHPLTLFPIRPTRLKTGGTK
ncbi:hypothetical protein ABN028_19580 [Actinopolymorpha sp. B17G11]|uniref:hypothetical protein n=1 Tax=Actinopolymorpha sp. B17G11 TaxID=3160861 RepID=UPI0032E3A794